MEPVTPMHKQTQASDAVYRAEQKATLASLVIGAKDLNGNTIKKVYARGDEYVIYEIAETAAIESLKVQIYTKIEDNYEPQINFQKVKDNFDRLKSILYKSGADSSYKHRASSAIVTAILGNVEESNRILCNIEKDAMDDYKHSIYGRLFYLLGSVIISTLLIFAALFVYINRESLFFLENKELAFLTYSVAYAALGGFFSVSLKAKEVFTQRAISYWMYTVYGAERLLVSIVSGIATYTLISSGLIFSSLITANSGVYAILSICFISGFSETLIPSSLSKIEKKA
jgi:hypothetical protein